MNHDPKLLRQLLEKTGAPELSALELIKRRAAQYAVERRRQNLDAIGLLPFTLKTFPTYRVDPMHQLIASTLDRVVSGDIRRLMIFAPPQHGKSELVSIRLPAYWLAQRPDDPVILASYGATLAYRNSKLSRNTIDSREFREMFPSIELDPTSRSVQQWNIHRHRGVVVAAGVGGPITGYGAMLGIIDDPHKDWAEAQSLTQRNSVWDWYRGTFATRMWENSAIVLIMTRWHEDDLAGRLLLNEKDRWTVLRLPALSETDEERRIVQRKMSWAPDKDPLDRKPGEALAPSRFSSAALLELKETVGSIVWSAEYQGAPSAPEGTRFKREWFSNIVDEAPANAERVRYWDKAGTPDGGARSAGVLIAHANGRWFIEHVEKGQWSPATRNDVIRQTALRDFDLFYGMVVTWLEQEPGSGGKESAEISKKELGQLGVSVYTETVSGSKDVRLEPFRAQAEAGNVFLVRGPWMWDWIDELVSLPNGEFRDQSDATSGAFNKLSQVRRLVSGENPLQGYRG